MKIILSDKKLDKSLFDETVEIKYINIKSLLDYDNNPDVFAIVGSRAMAKTASQMNLKGLKFFQLTSAGYDGVPLDVFKNKGIIVANAGDIYSVPIAETVVFGMLSFAKRLHNNPNNRIPKIQRHYSLINELSGKKVIILGTGNIGTAIAKRLSGFDITIDGYSVDIKKPPYFDEMFAGRNTLLDIIDQYDYVISTLPDNDETRGFLNLEVFNKMKKDVVVLNVGRRAVFNEKDFYYALKTKKIGGAVLDVFELVPNPIQNKFRRLRNVIVLPGVAAISKEVNARLTIKITKNIISLINDNVIENVIIGG